MHIYPGDLIFRPAVPLWDGWAFSELGTRMPVYNQFLYQTLNFVETVTKTPHQIIVSVGQSLAFTQNGPAHDDTQHLTQTLVPVDTASVIGTRKITANQTLAMSNIVWGATGYTRIGYTYQNLTIVQSVWFGKGHDQVQTLGLAETWHVFKTRPATSTLTFTQTAAAHFNRPLSVAQALVMVQSAVAYVNNPRVIGGGISPPSISHTTLLSTPVGSITLPSPDFSNTEELGQTRISRESRGGTYIIYRPSFWPTTDVFTVTFSYLNQVQVDRLQYLVSGSLGKLVTFIDHESVTRQGIITSADMTITQNGRANFSTSFQLMIAS